MPKLSIIVPVYNTERYVGKCLDSILKQSFKDFEILVIDDGSIDKSGRICDDYASIDSRIKVIHQKNAGLSAARNAGLRYAKGEFITFVDSDDYIAANMYELLLQKIEKCNADMVKCGYYEFMDDKITYTRKFDSEEIFYHNNDWDGSIARWLDNVLYIVVWNAVYRRNIAIDVEYPEGLINEDNYASPLYLLKSNSIAVIEEPLYYYRQNYDGLSKKEAPKKPLDVVFCCRLLLKQLADNGLENGRLFSYIKQSMSKRIYSVVKQNNIKIQVDGDLWGLVLDNARWDRKLKLKFWHYLGRIEVK